MKISDLSTTEQTNEGFGDFVKRTGLMGQANKQSAMSKQQDERAKSIGLKDFTYKLGSALKSAIASGVVVPTTPSTTADAPISVSHKARPGNPNLPPANTLPPVSNTAAPTNPNIAAQKAYTAPTDRDTQIRMAYKAAIAKPDASRTPADKKAIKLGQSIGIKESKKIKQYELFSRVVESRMLTESESISQFITQFIDTQTRNLVDNPNYQQNINMIAKKLEDQYSKTQKLDPKLVEQSWETIWAWSQLGKKRSAYNSSNQIVDMDHDGTDDSVEREADRKKIIQKINKTDFNDPDKLKLLKPDFQKILDMINAIP